MLRIGLFCASGMSTSILVKKIAEAAKEKNIEVSVAAYPESEMVTLLDEIDVALLGPQVRFFLNKAKGLCEPKNIAVDVINSMDYGMMNGAKVLEQAIKMKGNK